MNYKSMTKAQLIAHILRQETQTTLQVTSCQVYPFKDGPSMGHMKALASIVLNDTLQIRGLRVMDGENGLFVGYPVDPFFKGEDYRTVCSPITRAMREHIETVVLEHYQRSIGAEVANG